MPPLHFLILLLLSPCLVGSVKEESVDIRMPGGEPKGTDSYLCTAFNIQSTFELKTDNDSAYVTKFEGLAIASKAHHVLLYACNQPPKEKIWDCRHHSICKDGTSIMFAWAKNADPLSVPPDVSFKLSPKENKFLVLQVHYVHELPEPDNTGIRFQFQREPTKNSAGIYLLARSYLNIPPRSPVVHGDMNCKINSNIPQYPFAFRTHAHSLGVVITGYKYSSDKFTEIARGNPQWPQTFYPVLNNVSIQSGDYLVARCTYNSTSKNHAVKIGAESNDEMCNLYLMYYMESQSAETIYCTNEENHSITNKLPKDSDKPLPPNPELEEMAHHAKKENHTHHRGHLDVSDKYYSNERRKGILIEDLEENYKLTTIKMPGAVPDMIDDYRCIGYAAADLFPQIKEQNSSEVYVMGFLTDATSDKAHHLIISHCNKPNGRPGKIFQCLHHGMCASEDSKIMYAWAKDAPGTNLPPDAGFVIRADEYLVLQVHYKHPLQNPDYTSLQLKYTLNKPDYRAGMILMLRSDLIIPPKVPKTFGDVNCRIKTKEPMYLFAFRTHAHSLGSVITGYQFAFDPNTKNNSFKPLEIARGDPQLPQTFYGMKNTIEVEQGDILAARCTFDSTNMTTITKIGMKSGDEMCNLYLMYYSKNSEDFLICADEEVGHLHVPDDSTNPIQGPKTKSRKSKKLQDADLHPVPNWPPKETMDQIGQLSGVSIDVHGNPVIFHRGDRVWSFNTFKSNNEYNGDRSKPIPQNTILTLNSTGHIINAWGANMFFMPHMITVDKQNNVWVTDVALHQVMKFPPYGGTEDTKTPLIQLGKKFEPGSDKVHFCKPTAVAVMDDGKHFFVSDGYCNSRIFKYEIRFDSNGYHQVNVDVILHWGEANGAGISSSLNNYALNIPHGLALAEDKGLICVADRENGRVQCYNALNGVFVRSYQPKEFGRTIYSVAYTPANGGNLLAVGGYEPFYSLNRKKSQIYILDVNVENKVNSVFGADIISNPHDLAISKDGSTVYTVELNPYRVTKFTNGKVLESSGPQSPPHIPPTESPNTTPPSSLTEHAKAVLSKHIETLGTYVPKSRMTIGISVLSAVLTLLCSICIICRKCRKRGKGNMARNKPSTSSWKNKTLDLGDFLGRSKTGFTRLKTDEHDEEVSSEDSDLEDFTVPALNA